MNIHRLKEAQSKLSNILVGTSAVLLFIGVSALNQSAHADGKRIAVQSANVHNFGDAFDERAGAGILTRSAHEVWATISTRELDPNAAYSVWWVVFNRPGNCTAGSGPDPEAKCGGGDLGNADIVASVFYATGFVTGDDGTAHLSTHLKGGSVPKGADVVVGRGGIELDNGVKPGLKRGNGLGAEIHMVIRTHGEIIPGRVDEQIGSFYGACNPAADPPDPNVCSDQLALAFAPAQH